MISTDKREDEYIRFIAENDLSGLNAIYSNFLPLIINLVTANGGSSEDAKDIFQDAILIIYEKISSGNFVLKSKFSTLLYGVSRNLWGNRIQKKSFKEVTLEEDTKYIVDEDWEHLFEMHEEFKIFWSNFHKLGQDCQKLLHFFFEKRTMTEIQKLMGFNSLNYTKKRKFQCKEKLIQLIQNDHRYIEFMVTNVD